MRGAGEKAEGTLGMGIVMRISGYNSMAIEKYLRNKGRRGECSIMVEVGER